MNELKAKYPDLKFKHIKDKVTKLTKTFLPLSSGMVISNKSKVRYGTLGGFLNGSDENSGNQRLFGFSCDQVFEKSEDVVIQANLIDEPNRIDEPIHKF